MPNKIVVESFIMDYTKVSAPFITLRSIFMLIGGNYKCNTFYR
jgi:S-ribosylhomocysteine lyase LuxS involved in autoinducer biosynthesis